MQKAGKSASENDQEKKKTEEQLGSEPRTSPSRWLLPQLVLIPYELDVSACDASCLNSLLQ